MRGMASGMWLTLLKLIAAMIAAKLLSERLQQMALAVVYLLSW